MKPGGARDTDGGRTRLPHLLLAGPDARVVETMGRTPSRMNSLLPGRGPEGADSSATGVAGGHRSRGWPGRRALRLVALALALGFPSVAVRADLDHDAALRLREHGDILPLQKLVERLVGNQVGRLIEVELDWFDGRYVYEVEVLDAGGTLHRFYLDARSGQPVAAPPEHR